jgi:putative ubiquitin-RnfH superfamily antitoxin RatB of RatAB toxin-antitoxin module
VTLEENRRLRRYSCFRFAASQRYRSGENKVGIYSRPVKLGDVLKEGDRVEIYRPLIADPKELRRQRAEKSGSFFSP